jgi:TolA-binding protein
VGAKGLPAVGGDQGSALAQLALGQALYMKKDYPGALRAFLTIEVFYPSLGLLQPPALMGAANSYEGLGDKPRAIDTYDRIVSDWMNSPQVSEAKKKSQILSHS